MSAPEAVDEVAGDEGEVWQLRLYVAGQTPKSERALANLTTLCEGHLHGHYEIEVVDLHEHPERAKNDDILAVPTLVRRLPSPYRKVVGDLSDADSVMLGLRVGME